MIVLHDSTLNNFDGLSKNISRNRTEPFNNSRGLWEKIESLNDIRVGIDTSKITTLKTHILLKSESNEIFKNNVEGEWNSFYKYFPNAFGLFGFSRLIYGSAGAKGLIYVEMRRAPLWGRGVMIQTEKVGDKWIIIQIDEKWAE